MPTYYGDPSQAGGDTSALPVLRMPSTPPVQITAPRVQSKSGGGGGGGLNTAALGKKIAAMLQQKYGAGGQTIDLGQLPDDGINALSAVDAATIPQGINFSQLPDNFNFQV